MHPLSRGQRVPESGLRSRVVCCPFPSQSRCHRGESQGWSLPSPQPRQGAVTPARPSHHGSCCQKCCFPCSREAPRDGAAVFVPSVHVAVHLLSVLSKHWACTWQPWLELCDEAWGGSFGTASSPVLPGSTGLSWPKPSPCLGFASHAEPRAAPAMLLGVSI